MFLTFASIIPHRYIVIRDLFGLSNLSNPLSAKVPPPEKTERADIPKGIRLSVPVRHGLSLCRSFQPASLLDLLESSTSCPMGWPFDKLRALLVGLGWTLVQPDVMKAPHHQPHFVRSVPVRRSSDSGIRLRLGCRHAVNPRVSVTY